MEITIQINESGISAFKFDRAAFAALVKRATENETIEGDGPAEADVAEALIEDITIDLSERLMEHIIH